MKWFAKKKFFSFLSVYRINNNLLVAEVEDISSPNNATVNCVFLSGFAGSAHYTVQYGTDPKYMDLQYSAESTETGTAGDFVSAVLREQLNSSTVYYYTVSAVSGDITVITPATFTTPQYSMHYVHSCMYRYYVCLLLWVNSLNPICTLGYIILCRKVSTCLRGFCISRKGGIGRWVESPIGWHPCGGC